MTFDEPNLVSCAGLVPVLRLAERAGLHAAAQQRVRLSASELHAGSTGALALGEFTARVLGVSRAAGTMTGRFLPLLDAADQARMAEVYAGLPPLVVLPRV